MTTFFRWIMIALFIITLGTVVAVYGSQLMPDSTLQFWAFDTYGAYHYYYDFRTELLHLEKAWYANSPQIAPNGQYAVALSRHGVHTVFIDLLYPDEASKSLGEYPIDTINSEAKWSSDSETIYFLGNSQSSDNRVAIYSFNIKSLELRSIAEFEKQGSSINFDYDSEESLFSIKFSSFSEDSLEFYNLLTGERWTVKGRSLIVFEGGKEYLSLVSPDASSKDELQYISLVDNRTEAFPLPTQGHVINMQRLNHTRQLLVSIRDPQASYIFDLETRRYKQLETNSALIAFESGNTSYLFATDYSAYINNRVTNYPLYALDLKSYDLRTVLDAYHGSYNIIRDPHSFTVSPDNRYLAMLIFRLRGPSSIEIVSLKTGQLVHRFNVPEDRVVLYESESGKSLKWYQQ